MYEDTDDNPFSQRQFYGMQRWIQKWKQYRYRFVPWLAVNLMNRSLRSVTKDSTDLVLANIDFHAFIWEYLTYHDKQMHNVSKAANSRDRYARCLQTISDFTSFTIERSPSILPSGGQGVKVTSGVVPAGSVTSLYPGLIYQPYEPIFFQSIGNPFIFRCADGLLIDGNDKGLSKSLYKSCQGRDSCWPLSACDDTWLTPFPACPLNIGQYVNNQNKQYPANVAYQEFNMPHDFPAHLKQYLPNNHYASSINFAEGEQRMLRVVALISLREIQCGEELFSSYFTIVR